MLFILSLSLFILNTVLLKLVQLQTCHPPTIGVLGYSRQLLQVHRNQFGLGTERLPAPFGRQRLPPHTLPCLQTQGFSTHLTLRLPLPQHHQSRIGGERIGGVPYRYLRLPQATSDHHIEIAHSASQQLAVHVHFADKCQHLTIGTQDFVDVCLVAAQTHALALQD